MFKQTLLVLILASISWQIDLCRQFEDHPSCIASLVEKCNWDQHRGVCLKTHDYLQGCSIMLNRPACIVQLGTLFGELAKCRFTSQCEDIPNLTTEKCSSNLSKSGCLSIQNPEEICIWQAGECMRATDLEIRQIQSSFPNMLLSASACSRITGFLAVHHTILWKLLQYQPNLILEADNNYRRELGIGVEETVEYENPETVSMQNNFINSEGLYEWYVIRESKSITLRNLKRTSRTREGCIALEIENDNDYARLFSLTGRVYGVNHVYCKYLSNNTQNPINSVYASGYCQQIEWQDLRSERFIDDHKVSCKSLTIRQCLVFESTKQNCVIAPSTQEYYCTVINSVTSIDCKTLSCTQQQCKLMDGYYVDMALYRCVNNCYNLRATKDQCLTNASCKWFNQYLGDITNLEAQPYLTACGPTEGCEHAGLGRFYCSNLTDLCHWNQETQRCEKLTLESTYHMRCEQARNVLVCSMIRLSDQRCIWLKDRLQCINTQDNSLLRLQKFFYPQSAVNRILCNHYDMIPTHYDESTKTCQLFSSSTDQKRINRYNCLYQLTGPCSWNKLFQECNCNLTYSNTLCSTLTDVNDRVCQAAKVSKEGFYCLFDSANRLCYESQKIESIGCEGFGLTEKVCVSITTPGQYCQYEAGRCKRLDTSYINSIMCTSLQKVNKAVCVQHQIYTVQCNYDTTSTSCLQPLNFSELACANTQNRYSCANQQNGECYFDVIQNACTPSSPYFNVLTCENSYVSAQTCLKISTPKQKCYWNLAQNRCYNYNASSFNNCEEYIGSPAVCAALETSLKREFMQENYCEYSAAENQCKRNSSNINGCGSNLVINIHRCGGFTSGSCIFINQVCTSIDSSTVLGQIVLNQIRCAQANKSTCQRVTTTGQFCYYKDNVTGLIVDKKCNEVSLTSSYSCTDLNNLPSSGTKVNVNACSIANNICSYDSATQQCIGTTLNNVDCTYPGISKSVCLLSTVGRCMFYNFQCSRLNPALKLVDCSSLNQFACQAYSFKGCIWSIQTRTCIESQSYCASAPAFNLETTQTVGQSLCSLTPAQICIQQREKCISRQASELDKVRCYNGGLNKLGCLSLMDQFCVFRLSRCQEYWQTKCEDIELQEDCLSNPTPGQFCVFNNGKCYNVDNLNIDCDVYALTNPQFCQRYPKCVYNYQTNQCNKFVSNAESITQSVTCAALTNPIACSVTNYAVKCIYQSNTCTTFTGTACPHLQFYANEKVCLQFANCSYQLTKSSGGFCVSAIVNNCTQLPSWLCLENISDDMKCYLQGTSCMNVTQTTCAGLYSFQMNQPACDQFRNDCLFDESNKRCKPIRFKHTTCSSASNEIDCTQVESTCYFISNVCQTTGSLANINRFGCIQQATPAYRFNFINLKCETVTTQQNSCLHLNKKACLENTLYLECQWFQGQCGPVITFTACEDLNMLACLNVVNSSKMCAWSTTNTCQTITSTDGCAARTVPGNGTPAQNFCSSVNDGTACILNLPQKRCAVITQPIYLCSGRGLNQQACLNNTQGLNCYWHPDGYCREAIVDILKCTDLVSKSTCLAITTLGQYCKWTTQCEAVPIANLKCSEANNMNGSLACLAITSEACEYNATIQLCSKLVIQPTDCIQGQYNKIACGMVKNKKCVWEKSSCTLPTLNVVSCNSFINQDLCLQQTSISCQWKPPFECADFSLPNKVNCNALSKISLINKRACNFYSLDPCTLINNQCYPTISSDNLVPVYDFLSYAEKYDAPELTEPCERLVTLKQCIGSRKLDQACIWQDSQCLVLDTFEINCTSAVNLLACLKITKSDQYCTWQNQCMDWSAPALMSNVNINVCKAYSVSAIYSNYSCVIKDLSEISCQSPGISRLTCLSLAKSPCMALQDGLCIQITVSHQRRCADFTNVSPYVCSSQLVDSCVYDTETFSCKQFTPQMSHTAVGISKRACLSIKERKFYWLADSCIELTENIECDQALDVNVAACSTIPRVACLYDSTTFRCTSIFNINSLRCSTPGLNEIGCSLVPNEPCIFRNSRCEPFQESTTPCVTLYAVNAKACASLEGQICHYNPIERSCQSPLQKLNECQTIGLNKDGCDANQSCNWRSDLIQCQCGESQKKCTFTSIIECGQRDCVWEETRCVPKQCYHLGFTNCVGIREGLVCYLSLSGCQGARSCEDVLNAEEGCGSILINGRPCIESGRTCISDSNFEKFCPSSDCLNERCILDAGVCRAKKCQDYNPGMCNQIEGCLYYDSQCQDFKACSDINKLEVQDKPSLCNSLVVDGFKCNWQQYALLDSTLACTNRPCEFYGASNKLCQGNESNNYACVLFPNLVCKQCEQITDRCFCEAQNNVCYFGEGKCRSILCSDFKTKNECNETVNRCVWSDFMGGCVRVCGKIIEEEECELRKDECHFNNLLMQCIEGKRQVADLTMMIDIQSVWTGLIVACVYLMIAL